MRLLRHARRMPAGFRYTRTGLLVERVERLRFGSIVEKIELWIGDPDD